MTPRKSDNLLQGDRTPAYVGRETGAAELQISTETWDKWVKEGVVPPPCPAFPAGTLRWRWEDVDRKLSGHVASDNEAKSITTAELIERTKNLGKVNRRGRPRKHRVTLPSE
jgi:hypothetical protein